LSYTHECYACARSHISNAALAATEMLGNASAPSASTSASASAPSQGKYPSTPHLPFSPGVNSDDVLLSDCADIIQKEVVITEKLDGGNCCIKGGQVYARTHAQPATHDSFSAVKQMSKAFAAQLGNIELFGENMQGIHSIEYNNLTSFFYVFAARADGEWLAWDDVVALAKSLDLPTVPVVFRGHVESPKKLQSCLEAWALARSGIGENVNPEGFVVRRTHAFPNDTFADYMAKYVRANHVQTDADWKRTWKKAQLGDALPQSVTPDVTIGDAQGAVTQAEDSAALAAPQLARQESQPLPPAFAHWLRAAILEELPTDDAEPIIDCVEVILLGASSDPEAVSNAVDVLKDSGACLCASKLPTRWQESA